MLKKILATAVIASLSATPVMAGDASMRNGDGVKLRINCKNSGCKVRSKLKGQKWKVVEETEGGRDNFLKLEEKYKAQGYK